MRIIVGILLLLLLPGFGQAGESVELVTGEWAPYSSSEAGSPGLATEIVTSAFEAVGVEVQLKFMPWPRCDLLIREGQNVAAFPYVETAEKKRFALFSVPMLTERTYLYYSRQHLSDFHFAGYESLKKYRVGTVQGFAHHDHFKEHQVPALVMKNETIGMNMLLQDRLDLFPLDEMVAERIIKKKFMHRTDLFGRSKKPLYESSLFLIVSRNNPRGQHILDLFAKGMSIIRKNGTFNKIVNSSK